MRFAEEKVFLIIIGDGLLEKELKELVKKYNLQNRILFLGKIPQNELRKFTAGADCGLNLLEKLNKSKELAAPNKLFQYIHANIPVIASYSYENNKVFEKYKIGLQTENNINSISYSINCEIIEHRKNSFLAYNYDDWLLMLSEILDNKYDLKQL